MQQRRRADPLYHAGLRAHDLDPVRVVGQLVWRVGEESVHDGRVQHEVRPETRSQTFHLRKHQPIHALISDVKHR